MGEIMKCYLCNNENAVGFSPTGGTWNVDCDECEPYEITGDVIRFYIKPGKLDDSALLKIRDRIKGLPAPRRVDMELVYKVIGIPSEGFNVK